MRSVMAPLFESSFLENLFSSIKQISDTQPPNPFPHLTSSFSTPTTTDVTAIKGAFWKSTSHKQSIEKLLSLLKDAEKTLQAQLKAERDYRSRLQGMLSTVRLLPPEVLSNIFLMRKPEKIDHYSKYTLNHSKPWSISRVCRKWRYVCLSMPQLWAHFPPIYLNRQCTSGFFELFKIATELSFPHNVKLCLRETNAEKIERFEDILPRVHLLDVHVDLPMIKGLVERKESFKALKTAIISFTSNSSEEPPTLDFLTPVTSLNLSCRNLQRRRNDPTPYAVLRSVDSHLPNLTTFHGDQLPPSFLCRILLAAPLLRHVVMQDLKHTPSDTAGHAPTSNVRHINLRYLAFNSPTPDTIPHALFQHLQLPGLKTLHVQHKAVPPELFLSFLRETRGSLVNLTLEEPLGTLDNQREMYTLCPALNTFILGNAEPKNLGILTMSPQSNLCPALRYLTLRDFTLVDADDARVLEDFCSSRGLAPFKTPDCPANSSQLDNITVYPKSSLLFFRQHCLRVDNRSFDCMFISVRLSLSITMLQTFTHLLSDFLRRVLSILRG